ncbi:MAG: DUF3872 domain-containing protein [Dysgonomonas mossii]|uniref:DUF3872 domain-containing protein n=1 Tax=Dysgonomonas mossii TaxID=163665 RepID=UPI003991A56D
MRKLLVYTLYTLSLVVIACACSDNIDIKRDYEFEVLHLPVQKRIKKGETAEIRCQLVRSGNWEDARYYMRYFQPDGNGELKTEDGMVFKPNDLYEMTKETFRLYYTSQSEDQQVIDLYFLDNFGNMFTLSFSFNNESDKEED